MDNINNSNKFIYEEKYSHPYDIALNLTNDCNLACVYCFVEQKPEYMTLDIAIAAVEYMVKNLRLHKEIYKDIPEWRKANLWFFGGEPLLCFDSIIKPIVKYCQTKEYLQNDIAFSITTNVTLLDKEKVDFFKSIDCTPMLSIDGAPETQDYQRPHKNLNIKSSQLIEKNIPYILEQFPNILFRSTIYKPTIDKMLTNYLYAESLGFKTINFTPDTRAQDWVQKDYDNIKNQLYEIFAYRLYQYKHSIFPINWIDLTSNYAHILNHDIRCLNNQFEDDFFPLTNCGLGSVSAAIDYQGDIYSCQERPSKGLKDIYLLGNIKDGINYEKHKLFLSQYMQQFQQERILSNKKELCKSCLSKPWCDKSCISISKELFHNFNTINENWCIYYQLLMELSLNTMDILVKEKNKCFYLDLLKNNTDNYDIFANYIENNCF